MSIKTTLLAFAGGLYAAKLYQKVQAGGSGSASHCAADSVSSSSTGASTASTIDAADSPNMAERMRRDNSVGSPLADSPGLAQALDEGNLLGSDSGVDSDAPVPGLRDFSRGA
jgi:hypothetical protein